MSTNTPDRPAPKDKSHHKSPRRADGYDFMSLYGLSDADLERRIMGMDEAEYAAFSKWHDARIRSVLLHYRRKMPVKACDKLIAAERRHTTPAKLRIGGEPTNAMTLAVIDYLSGQHSLICRSQEDRDDLATVRAMADIMMEIMVDIGVTDRHEAACIIDARHTDAVRRRRAARPKTYRTKSRADRTGGGRS